jgi:hypothetical protein
MDTAVRMHNSALIGLLRVAERRARLNGLDAPVRADITVLQVDQRDLELAELMREAGSADVRT